MQLSLEQLKQGLTKDLFEINHRSFRFIDLQEIKHRYLINWLVHNENKGWKEKEPAETEKLVNNL